MRGGGVYPQTSWALEPQLETAPRSGGGSSRNHRATQAMKGRGGGSVLEDLRPRSSSPTSGWRADTGAVSSLRVPLSSLVFDQLASVSDRAGPHAKPFLAPKVIDGNNRFRAPPASTAQVGEADETRTAQTSACPGPQSGMARVGATGLDQKRSSGRGSQTRSRALVVV